MPNVGIGSPIFDFGDSKSLLFSSLKVTDVLYNGQSVVDSIIAEGDVLSGFEKGNQASSWAIKFNEIEGESITVQVKYTIVYLDGYSYVYPKDLTIENRQTIATHFKQLTNSEIGLLTLLLRIRLLLLLQKIRALNLQLLKQLKIATS